VPFINDMLQENAEKRRAQDERTHEQATSALYQTALPSRFLFDPEAVLKHLRSRIVAQDHALDALANCLRVIKADIRDPAKPLFVMLMLGPTGVGKTETVRLLAECIHGSPDAVCRIDMNTLAQDHYAAALTGDPPGYVGSKEGVTLFDPELIHGSFSRPGVVLFDEIEKASPEVVRSLLNLLDTGKLSLASGNRTLDFRNSLIFMTSNLGAAAIMAYQTQLEKPRRKFFKPSPKQQQARIRAITDAALQERFDPEFINRIDRICLFNPLGTQTADALIDIELAKLNTRLSAKQLHILLDRESRDWLARQGFDPRFGARSLSRSFRLYVEPALAEALLNQPGMATGQTLQSVVSDNKLKFQRQG